MSTELEVVTAIRPEELSKRLAKQLGENVKAMQEFVQGLSPATKMPSEIATIKFVRKHTEIPVPDIVAYDADSDGGVGGEWMVMEYVHGIPLIKAWATTSDAQRHKIVESVADVWADLLRLSFNQIGSLQEDGKDDFSVGPMTCLPSNNSRDITPPDPSHCGPFDSPKDWLLAVAARHLDFSQATVCTAEERAPIDKVVEELLSNPRLEAAAELEISNIALHHIDMNVSNILVDHSDPTRIVAVLDWEGARTVPLWAIQPHFFAHLEEASDEEVRDLQLLTRRAIGERVPMWLRATGEEGLSLRHLLRRAEWSPFNFPESDYEYVDQLLQGVIM
ncbi:hypothetical protein GLOTRDRAFT_95810 [Gloeophyllum trabeum ATCC 11539]|uniref:Aminoglycoside phosphotransferase domain-containing protein n=1 Tax=Gloeophyllum trabeum (strain ATCC 11539 / FP-39264 / Madison 617) TaxID=670483 RepID=S7PXU5_GLOTA|nr:uncharacterized protein GLOTRDRAFT_95810 [Gloeophyllum trabeum ATCC 11539]EPQ52152.1 hypothetical protein GLOTRDRAFT_95810 [Gloeophyllum trabeum ATCC 11539]